MTEATIIPKTVGPLMQPHFSFSTQTSSKSLPCCMLIIIPYVMRTSQCTRIYLMLVSISDHHNTCTHVHHQNHLTKTTLWFNSATKSPKMILALLAFMLGEIPRPLPLKTFYFSRDAKLVRWPALKRCILLCFGFLSSFSPI